MATPEGSGLTIFRQKDTLSTDNGDPVSGGSLRLFLRNPELSDLNPAAYRHDFQLTISYLDPLLRLDPVTLLPTPWLAESWEWSADGLSIRYTLRADVLWHDGESFTADDVAFSLTVYRDDLDSAVRNFFVLMERIEVTDSRSLTVYFAAPDGGWELNASSQPIFQERQYVEAWESRPVGQRTLQGFDWGDSLPIGTGPWRVAAIESARVDLSRNPAYWAGAAYMDRLELAVETEVDARLSAWTRGEVDLLWPVPPGAVARVEDVPGQLYVAAGLEVMFAAFNFQHPLRLTPGVFADARLRLALSLAIDRGGYAAEIFAGFISERSAGAIAQPWAYDPSITSPPRNVAEANRLMAEIGWEDRNGDGLVEDFNGIPLSLTLIVRNDARDEFLAVLERVVSDLAEIGVGLEVRRLNPDVFRERWIVAHDFDLIAYSYKLYPGFTDFDLYGSLWDIRVNPQGWNPGGYSNSLVDAVITEALFAIDVDDQRIALRTLQQLTNDDLFALWLGFPEELTLVRPDIRGFRPHTYWQTWDTRLLWRAPD
ncbi:MAG: ABC transporter substrate-binding protein [Chloroflexota bacterium]|nr:ABC transporter substrate-binding protein [Chloroflexota bacterium]